MKRNLTSCLATAIVLAVCLTLTGCGGSSGDAASPSADASSEASVSTESEDSATEEGFAGTWMLSELDDMDEDGLEDMVDSGYCMFFVLQEDGALSYEFLGFAEYGTYEAKSDTEAALSLDDEENWQNTMYLEDGRLKVESVDGGFAYFTRITEEEHQQYNATYDYDIELPSLDKVAAADETDSSSDSTAQEQAAEVNKVIADDDLCTIKVLDTFSDDGVVGYNVEVTNKSDRTLTFMSGGRSEANTVDGKEVSFMFYVDVEAGQTTQSEFDYWKSDLEGGAEKLVNVKGQVNVNDMSISDTIASYTFEL